MSQETERQTAPKQVRPNYTTEPTYAPVQELIAEHEQILAILSSFEAWADELDLQQSGDRLGLRAFLRYFVEFADGCHHMKEEQVLFATMQRYGFAQRPGPLESMTGEHDESREIVRRLAVMAGQGEAWNQRSNAQIRSLVKSFVVLKRHHIAKENSVLYPLVEAHLPPQAWAEIEQRFADIEDERECAGQRQEVQALAAELLARFEPFA